MTSPLQLRAALAADLSLAAMVSERIMPSPLEDGTELPAVSYSIVGQAPGPVSHDSDGGWERPRVRCDCWGAGYGQAWDLAGLVKAALRESDMCARIVMQLDMPEPEATVRLAEGNAVRVHRVIVDASLWTEID